MGGRRSNLCKIGHANANVSIPWIANNSVAAQPSINIQPVRNKTRKQNLRTDLRLLKGMMQRDASTVSGFDRNAMQTFVSSIKTPSISLNKINFIAIRKQRTNTKRNGDVNSADSHVDYNNPLQKPRETGMCAENRFPRNPQARTGSGDSVRSEEENQIKHAETHLRIGGTWTDAPSISDRTCWVTTCCGS